MAGAEEVGSVLDSGSMGFCAPQGSSTTISERNSLEDRDYTIWLIPPFFDSFQGLFGLSCGFRIHAKSLKRLEAVFCVIPIILRQQPRSIVGILKKSVCNK